MWKKHINEWEIAANQEYLIGKKIRILHALEKMYKHGVLVPPFNEIPVTIKRGGPPSLDYSLIDQKGKIDYEIFVRKQELEKKEKEGEANPEISKVLWKTSIINEV